MRQSDSRSAKRFLRPITYGLLSGAAVCLLLLVLTSLAMSLQDIPQMVVGLLSTLIFVAGGFSAGLCCAIFAREKGLFLGLCCGVCLFAVLMLASLAVEGPGFTLAAATKLAAVLFASALGGVLGVNKRKKFR